MEPRRPFDLTAALARWRERLARGGTLRAGEIDELEAHLFDVVDARVAAGEPEAEAFEAALWQMGHASLLEREFRTAHATEAAPAPLPLHRPLRTMTMSYSYLKIALRNLQRHPGYAVLNVAGLAVGMACCLLILLFVRDELSYDRFHADADRAYRVARAWYDESGQPTLQFARISAPIGPTLAVEMPEVERMARVFEWNGLVRHEDRAFDETRFFFVEPALFDILTVRFVSGAGAVAALAEPGTVVLTESTAARYFGDADPVGRVLQIDGDTDMRVTAVVADPPAQTHFRYDFLASFATIAGEPWIQGAGENWGGFNAFATYVRLAPGADPDALEARLPAFLARHYTPHIGAESRLLLQPVPSIHLHSHLDSEFEAGGDIRYVYLFGVVAVFILGIACVNFTNLATARAARRAKEVGVRKVLGAARGWLVAQFLGEALVLSCAALVLAAVLVEAVLPAFNGFSGKALRFMGGEPALALALLAGTAVATGLVAGSYPAFYLSGFSPAEVLKGGRAGGLRSRLRTVLVVGQFAIAIVLVVGVGVVFDQLGYLRGKALGFDREQLVVLPATDALRADFESARRLLVSQPGVRAVTAAEYAPPEQLTNAVNVTAEVGGQMRDFESLSLMAVDHDYAATLGLEVVAGRSFSKEVASDSAEAVVLNETAVRQLGWASAEAAVGSTFVLNGGTMERRGQVVGVVRDFHFESLHERISPLVLYVRPDRYRDVLVRIDGAQTAEVLAFLEAQWRRYRPGYPFAYDFVDQLFGQRYEAEERLGRLVGVFAGLALFVAGLGLFGLATFAAEQRTKEIGVRKVMGASVARIVLLLSGDFARLVGIAFVVAAPVAYVATAQWLDTFAYHVHPGAGRFLAAGLAALAIALLAVSYQALRAALADPVKALRHE